MPLGGIQPLVGVLGYGLLIGSLLKQSQALEHYDRYLLETSPVRRTFFKEQWQKEEKQTRGLAVGAAIIWGINIIWTLAANNEESRYRKIKTEIKFDNISKNGEISLNYQIGK